MPQTSPGVADAPRARGRDRGRDHGNARLTIGLPVFDGEAYLEQCLVSILDQDLEDLVVLVGDNASTDRTPAIAASLARRDPRVRLLTSDRNRGAAWNFNRLAEQARTEYFKWQAADDLLAPGYLRRCVDALDGDPGLVLAHTRTLDVDEHGLPIAEIPPDPGATSGPPHLRFREMALHQVLCLQVFGVIRTRALQRTGLIGPYSMSDKPLLAELALHGRFHEDPEPLFLHREHADRSIRAHPENRGREVWFDPDRAGTMVYPYWRLGLEHWRAIRRAPLSSGERARALWQLAWWVRWWRGYLIGEALHGITARVPGPRRRVDETPVAAAPER